MELPRLTCLRNLTETDFLSYLSRVTSAEGFERRQVQKTPLLKLVPLQSSFLPQTVDDCAVDSRAQTRLLFPLPHQEAGAKKALVRSEFPALLHELSQLSQANKTPGEVWLVGHRGSGITVFSYYLLNAIFDFATEDFGLLLPASGGNGLWHLTRRKVAYVPLHENECPRTVWSDERHRHRADLPIGKSWLLSEGVDYEFPDNIEAALRIRLVPDGELGKEKEHDLVIRIPKWNSLDLFLTLFWCHRNFLKDLQEVEERIRVAGPVPGFLFAPDILQVKKYLTDQVHRAVQGEAVEMSDLFLDRLPISTLVADTIQQELQLKAPIESLWDHLVNCAVKPGWSDNAAEQTEPETDPTSATRQSLRLDKTQPLVIDDDLEVTTKHANRQSTSSRRLTQSDYMPSPLPVGDKHTVDVQNEGDANAQHEDDATNDEDKENVNVNKEGENAQVNESKDASLDEARDTLHNEHEDADSTNKDKADSPDQTGDAKADEHNDATVEGDMNEETGEDKDVEECQAVTEEMRRRDEDLQQNEHPIIDQESIAEELSPEVVVSSRDLCCDVEDEVPRPETEMDEGVPRQEEVPTEEMEEALACRRSVARERRSECVSSEGDWQDRLSTERTFGDGSPAAMGSPTALQAEDGETPSQTRMQLPAAEREETVPVSPMADGTRQHATELEPIVWISAPSTEEAPRQLAKQATTDMIAEIDVERQWSDADRRSFEDKEEEEEEEEDSVDSMMTGEWSETLLQDIEVLEAQRAKAAREMRVCEAALFTMKRKLSFYKSDTRKRRKEGN